MINIYKITNIINNKVYIGQTKRNIIKRFKQHYKDSKRKDFIIYRAFNKYGFANFSINKIDEANSIIEANEREKFWIEYYSSINPKYGYNISEGGYNTKHTKEIRLKISKANKGRKLTDEQLAKMKNSKRGLITEYNKNKRIKIFCNELNQEFEV